MWYSIGSTEIAGYLSKVAVVVALAAVVVVVDVVVDVVVVALAALAVLVAEAKLVRCPSASGQPELLLQKLGWQHFVDLVLVLDLCHSFLLLVLF